MTWTEYARHGVAPTVWFVILSLFALSGAWSLVADLWSAGKRWRAGAGFALAGVVGLLLAAIIPAAVLTHRVDEERRLDRLYAAMAAQSTQTASARCRDGTYSFSFHRRGTCSWHGGVWYWINEPSS
jgi:hypothetical protein